MVQEAGEIDRSANCLLLDSRDHDFYSRTQMIYLAITPQGLHDILEIAKDRQIHVWCGADALSESAFQELSFNGLTRFNYPLWNADALTLEDALSTIKEHHPGERIWVEHGA